MAAIGSRPGHDTCAGQVDPGGDLEHWNSLKKSSKRIGPDPEENTSPIGGG